MRSTVYSRICMFNYDKAKEVWKSKLYVHIKGNVIECWTSWIIILRINNQIPFLILYWSQTNGPRLIGKERPPKQNDEKLSKLKMASGVMLTKLELHNIAENAFLFHLLFFISLRRFHRFFTIQISLYVCLSSYCVEI